MTHVRLKEKISERSQFAYSDQGDSISITKANSDSVTFQATTPVAEMLQNKRRAASLLQILHQTL